jgi:hypothetical protein
MENLNIESFNPTKAELSKLTTKYKGLKIKGIDDKDGYKAVDTARKELKAVRRQIQITGKGMRASALSFQKEVIAREKEFVDIIEPLEKELAAKQKEIDDEKERLDRVKFLPDRRVQLAEYHIIVSDEDLLAMDSMQFEAFKNAKISEVLAERTRELEEKERKIAEERRIADENSRREREMNEREEKVRQEERERAEFERAEKERAEAEEKRIQAEADRLTELARIEREKLAKQDAEEKNRRYKAFIKKNGCAELPSVIQAKLETTRGNDFIVLKDENGVIHLYKHIDQITIK